jgi:hypothetical protein
LFRPQSIHPSPGFPHLKNIYPFYCINMHPYYRISRNCQVEMEVRAGRKSNTEVVVASARRRRPASRKPRDVGHPISQASWAFTLLAGGRSRCRQPLERST